MIQETVPVTPLGRVITRRQFLATTTAASIAGSVSRLLAAPPTAAELLKDQVGVTTSSFSGHLVASPNARQFSLTDLPKLMRDELDMRVIDLNTSSLGSQEPKWLEKVRTAVADAGCVMINLKLNQRGHSDSKGTHRSLRGSTASR